MRCSKDVSTGLWMMPLTNNIEGDDVSLNDRNTKNTPELVLAGILYHKDPTIQSATMSESDWASSVRQ